MIGQGGGSRGTRGKRGEKKKNRTKAFHGKQDAKSVRKRRPSQLKPDDSKKTGRNRGIRKKMGESREKSRKPEEGSSWLELRHKAVKKHRVKKGVKRRGRKKLREREKVWDPRCNRRDLY